jgi:hypothetical protein
MTVLLHRVLLTMLISDKSLPLANALPKHTSHHSSNSSCNIRILENDIQPALLQYIAPLVLQANGM